jgi:hypothetical protein
MLMRECPVKKDINFKTCNSKMKKGSFELSMETLIKIILAVAILLAAIGIINVLRYGLNNLAGKV